MKITTPGNFISGRIAPSGARTGQAKDSKFLDQLQQASDSVQIADTRPTGTLPEIQSARFTPTSDDDSLIFQKASDTLDQFESYIRQLSDPGTTLKEIEPALNDLVGQAEALYTSYAENGTCSPKLKQILEQLLMETRLEQFKFQRGDYVDV